MWFDYHSTQPSRSCASKLRRLLRRLNEAFEYVCVYCLVYFNWLCAVGFAAGYLIMWDVVFPGAKGPVCK